MEASGVASLERLLPEQDQDMAALVDRFAAVCQARVELQRCREKEAETISRLVSMALEYVKSGESESDCWRRAAYVYWNIPEVKAGDLADIMVGNGSTLVFVRSLPPGSAFIECESCGAKIPVRSRSQAKELKSEPKRRYSRRECEGCKSQRQAESAKNWEIQQREQELRAEELQTMPYREYLKTPEWLETRISKLKSASFRCQLCNVGGQLDVHHRTYERRGAEWSSDLIVLCRNCHGKFHDKL